MPPFSAISCTLFPSQLLGIAVFRISYCIPIVNYKHHHDNVISFGLSYHTFRGDKMIADRIKYLREQKGLTQARLAKLLGITRSSVNAWELGISVPSTQYLVELADIFKVSADYLLGINSSASISVSGLGEDDIQLVYALIAHLKKKNTPAAEM